MLHVKRGVYPALPHSVPVGEVLSQVSTPRQDPALKTIHGEEHVGIVLAVHRHKGMVIAVGDVLPLQSGYGAGQPVLDVPEHSSAEVDVVLHQPHPAVPGPAPLVVVPHNVLVVRVWLC